MKKKKEKGFDNSSQHLKTMLRGVYIQNILLTNAVWQQETVSPLEDEVELLFFLGLGTYWYTYQKRTFLLLSVK